MGEENTIDFRARVKKLNTPKSRQKSGPSQQVRVPDYSREWKQLCYEILLEVMARKAEARDDKTFSWLAMRDEIMRDYDDLSAPTKVVGRSTLLTVNDLNAWERNQKSGQSIGDEKFRFIDDYIYQITPNRDLLHGIRNVQECAERRSMAVFSEIYQRRRLKHEIVDRIMSKSEYLHSVEVADCWFKYIVLRFNFAQSNLIRVTCAYCPFDITKQNRGDIDNILFYEGYLIPMPEHDGEDREGAFGMTPDGIECVLKLFRPEYQGHPTNGYAETKLSIRESTLPGSGTEILSVTSHNPNTLLAPFGFPMCDDRRFVPEPVLDLERFRFRENEELSEFLAEIFRIGYKGYLF